MEINDIKFNVSKNTIPISIVVENLLGSLNLGIIVRLANAFGFKKVYYVGKKHWDKRSAVGTYNYTEVEYISYEQLTELSKNKVVLGAENLVDKKTIKINDNEFNRLINKDNEYLLLFGEEGTGLSNSLLDLCNYIIEIEQFGSVRSLNVSSAAAIIIYSIRKIWAENL